MGIFCHLKLDRVYIHKAYIIFSAVGFRVSETLGSCLFCIPQWFGISQAELVDGDRIRNAQHRDTLAFILRRKRYIFMSIRLDQDAGWGGRAPLLPVNHRSFFETGLLLMNIHIYILLSIVKRDLSKLIIDVILKKKIFLFNHYHNLTI